MNFDITWCSGSRCKNKSDCQRWSANLEFLARAKRMDLGNRCISIATFANEAGICEGGYIPLDESNRAAIDSMKRDGRTR